MTNSQLFANTVPGIPYLFSVLLSCCLFLSQSFGYDVGVDGLIAFIVIKWVKYSRLYRQFNPLFCSFW